MDGLEVRDPMRYLGDECTVTHTPSGGCALGCPLLRQLILTLDHSLDTFRQVELSVPVDDFLQNAFPPLCLLLVDPTQQTHLAVPGHGSRHELVLLSTEVAVQLGGFRHDEMVGHMDLTHDF